jgi:uncharacterized membrane protein YgcG
MRLRSRRPERLHRSLAALIGLLVFASLLLAFSGFAVTAEAQSTRSFSWHSIDIAIDVDPSGVLHITDTQSVDFAGAPAFTFAFLELETRYVEDYASIGVAEIRRGEVIPFREVDPAAFDRAPGTFSVSDTGDVVRIDYGFDPTSGSERRTFQLTYDAIGAIRVYPAAGDLPASEQLWWTGITPLVTDLADVADATITVTFPQPLPLDQLRIGADGDGSPADYTSDGRVFTWSASNLGAGDSLEARIAFPPSLGLAAPSWQARDDQLLDEQADRDRRDDRIDIVAFALGLLMLVGGLVALFSRWYTRGRDPQVGLVADILPEPPDDLAPGIAAALVDERAGQSALVATLLDLGRRDVLQLDDAATGGHPDLRLTLLDPDADLAPFEAALVTDLFGARRDAGDAVVMSKRPLDHPEKVFAEIDAALVTHGYYSESPGAVRGKNSALGIAMIVVGALGFFLLPGMLPGAGLIVVPCAALVVLGIVAVLVGRAMPSRTLAGAEAAAKWRAFKRHLADLDERREAGHASDLLARHLPYATAFGVDTAFISKLASVEAAPPPYFGPIVVAGPRRYERRPATWMTLFGGSGQRDRDGGGDLPSLGEANAAAAARLGAASVGLASLLDSGRAAFTPKSSSSSGSRSGGFGGGGSSGGGGGGGSRGFG